MMPGMTTRPSPSRVFRAPESRPMSVISPSLMPTSARRMGSPAPSTTVPPLMIRSKLMRLPSRRPPDVLELAVGRERPAPAVAADAGALVAAEGCVGVERAAVHLHRPGAQRARHPERTLGVARPHVTVEAVVRVVGERDRLGLVAKRDGADQRAEDLLPRDHHVVAYAGEERRLDVVAAREVRRALPSAGERRALGDALGDVALDARAPTAELPVNEIMSTSAASTSASPISGPWPPTKLSTPGGRTAATIRQSAATPSGSAGAGFTTTVLPQASAAPIFPAQFVIGKLKGVMQATTPIGSRATRPCALPRGGRGSSAGTAASSAARARRTATAPTCCVSATA